MMKESKSQIRYQSPVCQKEKKGEEFSSPINQWISSPFCQLDILSPNDGSLAFSISSPVQLSPYLPTCSMVSKSPVGEFSPSIFSAHKESAFLDDIDSAQSKKSEFGFLERIVDDELDIKSPLRGQKMFSSNPSPISSNLSAASLRNMNLKKTSLYGRPSVRAHEENDHDKKFQRIGYGTDLFQQARLATSTVELREVSSVLPTINSNCSPTMEPTGEAATRDVNSSKSAKGSKSVSQGSAQRRQAISGDIDPTSDFVDSTAITAPSPDDSAKCNCKKSKCLKLYCECFVAMKYCSNVCKCRECYNNHDHDDARQEAIRLTKTRNGTAFQAKVSAQLKVHLTGCNCKQSQCLKKYCECFTGNALCGSNCKCYSCQNFGGSQALAAAKRTSNDLLPTTPSLGIIPKIEQSPSSFLPGQSFDTPKNSARQVNGSQILEDNEMMVDDGTPAIRDVRVTYGESDSRHSESSNGSVAGKRSRTKLNSKNVPPTSGNQISLLQQVQQQLYRDASMPPEKLSRMNTRGQSRQGPGGPQSSDIHKGKYRRTGQGTSPMGVTDLSSVVSPMGSGQEAIPLAVVAENREKPVIPFPHMNTPIVYPFFGENHYAPKIIALRCLEYLDGPNLYNMSLVNTLWCKAAMDDALWE